jgi:hypothetical protein
MMMKGGAGDPTGAQKVRVRLPDAFGREFICSATKPMSTSQQLSLTSFHSRSRDLAIDL